MLNLATKEGGAPLHIVIYYINGREMLQKTHIPASVMSIDVRHLIRGKYIKKVQYFSLFLPVSIENFKRHALNLPPIQHHGYGLWYPVDGNAIVRTERKGIFTGMKDHYKVPHFYFFVVDLNTQSTTKLNLPLDKGSARQCVIRKNGLEYITANSDREGSFT
ncbi:MAG: hypothetical protein ABIN80_15220 [Dyadobacter sp.]|uniref:hypothetical protein n=1 Tax=Dyadobacter sp. TaxID=1914288 RepID=UPI0032636839